MFTLPILDRDGKEIEKVKLDEKVFDDKVLSSSVYQVVCAFRAGQRKGLAATKTRGEVSGGGKKPWKQKGTGRARVGSARSPLWRHGGVIFGPHPRDFSFSVPVKIKRQALKFALSEKAKEKNLIIVDSLSLENPKTKDFISLLAKLKVDSVHRRVLVVLDTIDAKLKRAGANIENLDIDCAKNINTYEVLRAQTLVITRNSLKELQKRLQ